MESSDGVWWWNLVMQSSDVVLRWSLVISKFDCEIFFAKARSKESDSQAFLD